MKLTTEQYAQLLKPLNASRIAQRNQSGISLSYLEAWDVKAHLIRIFGFGGWSADVLSADLMFEDKDEKGRWNVGYKVIMRLRIDAQGDFLGDTTYTEAAVGSATLPQRGEAHDMAVKTAESDALKRAAINLGTQFGLSLYDNGNRNDVVKATLVPPVDWEDVTEPVRAKPDTARQEILTQWVEAASVSLNRDELKMIWDTAFDADCLDDAVATGEAGATLRQIILDRLEIIDGKDAD
jgi:recombination DNA repair RAD52 pathway protein